MQILHAAQLLFPAFVNAIGWTLLHSLWQGGLAAILTLLILSVTKRSGAATRYNLLLFVFALFICSIIVTFLHEAFTAGSLANNQLVSSAGVLTSNTSINDSSFRVVDQTSMLFNSFEHYFNIYGGFIVAAWFVFFCFHFMKFGIGLGHIYHIRHVGTNLPPSEFQERCNALKKKLAIRINVSLIESTRVRVPVVIGFIKPMILVPVGLLASLPCNQVESILLHELAHIRRGDFLANLVQSITDTIFFFNPAVLWISSLIREEREACCDDLAIQELGSRSQYVEALVSFRLNNALPLTGNALAFPGTKNYLLDRVKRIISNENKKLGFMEKSILFSGLVAIMLVTSLITAQGNEQKKIIAESFQAISAVTDTVPIVAEPADPVEAIEHVDKSDIREEKENEQESIDEPAIYKKKLRREISEAKRIQEISMKKSLREAAALQDENRQALKAMISAQKAEINKNEVNALIKQAQLMKQLSLVDAGPQMDKEEMKKLLYSKQAELAEIQAATTMAKIESQQRIEKINQEMIQNMNHENIYRLKMMADRGSNDQVDEILDALMENEVIKKIEGTSFTLNNKELVVNGVKQSESLHNELKDKFLDDKEDYITYSSKKGSVSITIHHKD